MFLDGFDPEALHLVVPPIVAAVLAITVGAVVLAIAFTYAFGRGRSAADVPVARPCDGIADRIGPRLASLRDVRTHEPRLVTFTGPAAKGFRRRDPVIGRDYVIGERRQRVAALNRSRR